MRSKFSCCYPITEVANICYLDNVKYKLCCLYFNPRTCFFFFLILPPFFGDILSCFFIRHGLVHLAN